MVAWRSIVSFIIEFGALWRGLYWSWYHRTVITGDVANIISLGERWLVYLKKYSFLRFGAALHFSDGFFFFWKVIFAKSLFIQKWRLTGNWLSWVLCNGEARIALAAPFLSGYLNSQRIVCMMSTFWIRRNQWTVSNLDFCTVQIFFEWTASVLFAPTKWFWLMLCAIRIYSVAVSGACCLELN